MLHNVELTGSGQVHRPESSDRRERGLPIHGDTGYAGQVREKALAELERQIAEKDGAYLERNRLVSLLSKVFPSGKKVTYLKGLP